MELLQTHAKTALWSWQGEVSYDALLRKVTDYSSQLPPLPTGSRVLLFSENRPAYAYAVFASWSRGATVVPVDCASSAEDLAYILKDCPPAVLWSSAGCRAVAQAAIAQAGSQATLLDLSDDDEAAEPQGQPCHIERGDDETALIIYTSGTTGSPKGVMLSFRNCMVNILSVSQDVPIFTPDARTLVLLPLHHCFPLMGSLLAPLITGGSVAFCPSMNAADLTRTLQASKPHLIIGVPRLYAMLTQGIMGKIEAHALTRWLYKLCRAVGSRRLSRLVFGSVRRKMGGKMRYFVSGGAALDPAVATIMKTLGLDVLEGYGMTECAPMISFTRPNDIHPGASGQPLPRCEVAVIDGELCARGENVMQGYYGRPEETRELIHHDGWLHSGDLGYIDQAGRVVVTGRRKEIIVLSNGKNVNPVDIEQELERFTAYVKEAAVTDDEDQLVALVVPPAELLGKSDGEIEEIVKWHVLEPYNKEAATYKKVFQARIVRTPLPRTKLDKLQRFKLHELLAHARREEPTAAAQEEAQGEEYAILKRYIETEKKVKLKPTDHVELDLGFDSLDLVGLQMFINNSFGLELSTEQLTGYKSVGELAEAVSAAKTRTQVEKVDWKALLREHVNVKLPGSWFTGRLFVLCLQPFLKLYFKLKGHGAEQIPEGPVILAPNHQSFIDGIFVLSFLKWRDMRNTYLYAKQEHVKRPLVKLVAATHNVIVMDMGNLKESIQKLGEALKEGKRLIIFPEGTRTKDGQLGEFKKTFAILSKELGVPVVPVSIKGAYDALPKGCKVPRPRPVDVEFLPPIYPAETDSYEGLTEEVRNAVSVKLGEVG